MHKSLEVKKPAAIIPVTKQNLGAIVPGHCERELFPEEMVRILIDELMDQFGDFDGGLVGIDRMWAEYLARNWLRKLGLDEPTIGRDMAF